MGNPTCIVCAAPSSPWPTLFLAAVAFVTFGWLVVDAYLHRATRGWHWVAVPVAGAIFGFIVEWLNTQTGSGHLYCYEPFPVINLLGVPLWVAAGWGSVIYASMWTAQLLKLPQVGQAIAAAFLAVSVDFSLDPVAELFGFWKWECFDVNFFKVPFDNYCGWYLIVFVFALVTPRVLNRNAGLSPATPGHPPTTGSPLAQWGVVIACALVSVAVLVLAKALLGSFTQFGGDNGKTAATVFIVLTLVGSFVTFWLGRARVNLPLPPPVNWPVMIVPAVIHLACYLLFLTTGFTFSPFQFVGWTVQSALVASIPIQLIGGLFVFTTPWRR